MSSESNPLKQSFLGDSQSHQEENKKLIKTKRKAPYLCPQRQCTHIPFKVVKNSIIIAFSCVAFIAGIAMLDATSNFEDDKARTGIAVAGFSLLVLSLLACVSSGRSFIKMCKQHASSHRMQYSSAQPQEHKPNQIVPV